MTPSYHTEATASDFVRAVCERPADDAPRLLYADWLEERGECERAEFVRVQVELASLGIRVMPNGVEHYRPGTERRVIALRRRERELLSSVWESFVLVPGMVPHLDGTDHPSPGPASAAVARGFVATVRAPLAVLLGEPCGRCRGEGFAAPYSADDCPACAGTGRTPGTLAKLFAAAPIVAVEASDLQPTGPIEHGRQRGQWFYPRRDLPDDLWWWRLAPYSEGHPQVAVYYPTREDATRELSDELVRLGRSLAGLPKLEGRR